MGLGVIQRDIAAGPEQAFVVDERQALCVGQKPFFVHLNAKAPRQALKSQWQTLRTQPRLQPYQAHVGRGPLPLPFVHIGPKPQAALPLQLAPVICPLSRQRRAHGRQIELRKKSVGLPRPIGESAGTRRQNLALELPHQDKTLTPCGRRCRIDSQAVRPSRVADDHIHFFQNNRGAGCCRRVGDIAHMPAQHARPHNDLALRKKPVCGGRIGLHGRPPSHAAHLPKPIGRSPNVQFGGIQHQLVELPKQGRAQAQGHGHLGQKHGWQVFFVEQLDVAQLKRGHPARALRGHRANPNRYTQGLTGKAFHGGTVFVDSRHNPKMQARPGHSQHQTCEQQAPQRQPNQSGQPALQTGFSGGQGGWVRHKHTN